jgi:hypothetical protein
MKNRKSSFKYIDYLWIMSDKQFISQYFNREGGKPQRRFTLLRSDGVAAMDCLQWDCPNGFIPSVFAVNESGTTNL